MSGRGPKNALSPVYLGWMIRSDLREVVEIEKLSFEFPWTREDFIRGLRMENHYGRSAKYRDKVVGFIIYELHDASCRLLNLAVHPDFRRRGIGTLMIKEQQNWLFHRWQIQLLTHVRESNLAAQQFFREHGFKAVRIVRENYEDSSEDSYLMQYRCPDSSH